MPASGPLAADTFGLHTVTDAEIEVVQSAVRSEPDLFSTDYVRDRYLASGHVVISDPFDGEVSEKIASALAERSPYSVVRIGDGEMNLLSFGAYAGTANLDRYCVAAAIETQQDRFAVDEHWFHPLRDMMRMSVLQADIVGVLGLWRPPRFEKFDELFDSVTSNLRGAAGQWRGIDYMLRLARQGELRGKLIASAHLYFGVLKHLAAIIPHSRETILITDSGTALESLQRRYPESRFRLISVGIGGTSNTPLASCPRFLDVVAEALPSDLMGCCCFVGAGPWAEVYCSWIKQRGGVGVDLGSGFDLLAGKISRPIHRAAGYTETRGLA